MSGAETDRILDLRGLTCPLPVLKTRKRLARMGPADRLVVLTTDPLAALDIPAFCHEAGHRLINSEADGDGHRFTIERT